jgi:hypothetical protein
MKIAIANLLRKLANLINPNKMPAPSSTSMLTITRMNGTMIGMGQWLVQALLTNKTPHPGHHDSVTVFFPQLDLKMVSDGDTKTFELKALITTMKYSSFGQLKGTISIRPKRQGDSRISEWHIIDAKYELTGWKEKARTFWFNEDMQKHRELTHLESHFMHYFDRFVEDDRPKV